MAGFLERKTVSAAIAATLAFSLGAPAGAAVLYKSVDRDGHITFADSPIEGAIAVQRIQVSDEAKIAVIEATTSAVPSLADASDDAIVRANAKLDAAEHALALVRQEIAPPLDNLNLRPARPTRADHDRLEFYKRDVIAARRDLLRILKQRRYFTPPETTLVAAR
ncbi:MAG: DUF4124 domain-containing protein [Bacillota bacterium]